MNNEKNFHPWSGYVFIVILIAVIAGTAYAIFTTENAEFLIIGIPLVIFLAKGLFFIYPNGSRVLTLFGKYVGTVKKDGLFWVNPFYARKNISLRARNFDSETIKVNDKRGNPILINVILVWRVQNTYKAAFEVDHYESFVRVQTDAAVRSLATQYGYDNFDDNQEELTLRSSIEEVNDSLEQEVSDRLAIAGIDVMEARIGYLAYAPEIASAMLRRQQAEAIVAARFKIVEGAVSMVELALDDLDEKDVVDLDEEKKAAMVSNLMVVLCSDRDATPVLNTGTLHT